MVTDPISDFLTRVGTHKAQATKWWKFLHQKSKEITKLID